jgi:hypothetical protein
MATEWMRWVLFTRGAVAERSRMRCKAIGLHRRWQLLSFGLLARRGGEMQLLDKRSNASVPCGRVEVAGARMLGGEMLG